jgi:hypothetical protein
MSTCSCDWSTGECQSPLGCRAINKIKRLHAAIEDAVETLEAMDLHVDNPLYDRLRTALEQSPRYSQDPT